MKQILISAVVIVGGSVLLLLVQKSVGLVIEGSDFARVVYGVANSLYAIAVYKTLFK